jgi:hypothetical protein
MRNIEKVRRSAASNLLVQFPLAELTLQLTVDPSKSQRSIPARANGRSQQKPTVDPSKNRWLIPTQSAQFLIPFLSPDFAACLISSVSDSALVISPAQDSVF